MLNKKPKGVKVYNGNRTSREELERNHKELQEMLANGWKPTIKPKRQRVKSSEVKQPKKVTITDDNCSWMITVTFEQYLKKGGKSKIVARFY